ncbi:albusnodin/ikarugamycin family macrolactam cyclase [Streptosporangium sp. 'caverna']|uniref:albusnodin/ikarugamycin family macrolactam cyclase n=1 Tax=Streptosporangium sp. 'caverna' TaxID=2202249 RepID=UPI0013A6D9E4|nr:albusnodin/ikarugamycin family macrolactam cyclase [Streptosporangium sp. 'caverna']
METPQAATPTRTPSTTGEPISAGFLIHLRGDRLTDEPDLPGAPVWPGVGGVRLYGPWLREHVLTGQYGPARLLVLGHCLASQAQVEDRLATAIERDDPDLLTRFSGAYGCVLVRGDEVRVYADLAGQFTAYFSTRGDRTLIAQHASLIAALHGRGPDPLAAAIQIVCPNVLPMTTGRTFFQDVEEIEGGCVLSAISRQLHVRKYHASLPEKDADVAASVAALRSAVTDGVRLRCRAGIITSDFSGGIDSTSLALMATRFSTSKVRAVVYHYPPAPAADLAEAVRASALNDRIVLSTVHGSTNTLPYQGLHKPHPRMDWPAVGALAHRRAMLRLHWARSSGSILHLTGEGADALLHPAPSYLAELVRTGAVFRLARDSATLARLRKVSAAGLAVRAVRLAGTTPADALRGLGKDLAYPHARPSSPARAVSWWSVSGESAGWLTPRMRTALGEIATDPATVKHMPEGAGPADHAALAELRAAAQAQRFLRELGTTIGLAVHAPYLDSAVVDTCLKVPARLRADPSRFKPLLAEALSGVVPHAVLSRRTKGAYQAEEYLGARRARRDITALMAESRLVALGIVDPVALDSTLTRLYAGAAVPLGSLNRLLSLETWLRGI